MLVYHVKLSLTLLVGEGLRSSLIDESQCLKVSKWLTVASVEWVDSGFVNDVSEHLVSMVFLGGGGGGEGLQT